jgi:hypothetical protein
MKSEMCPPNVEKKKRKKRRKEVGDEGTQLNNKDCSTLSLSLHPPLSSLKSSLIPSYSSYFCLSCLYRKFFLNRKGRRVWKHIWKAQLIKEEKKERKKRRKEVGDEGTQLYNKDCSALSLSLSPSLTLFIKVFSSIAEKTDVPD